MVFDLEYTAYSFPFVRLAIGAAFVWLGLNISIVITENSEDL